MDVDVLVPWSAVARSSAIVTLSLTRTLSLSMLRLVATQGRGPAPPRLEPFQSPDGGIGRLVVTRLLDSVQPGLQSSTVSVEAVDSAL